MNQRMDHTIHWKKTRYGTGKSFFEWGLRILLLFVLAAVGKTEG